MAYPKFDPLVTGDRITHREGNRVGSIKEVDEDNRRILVYWGKDREMEACSWETTSELTRFHGKCFSPEEVMLRQAPDKLVTVKKFEE